MKSVITAIGALSLAVSAAHADPVPPTSPAQDHHASAAQTYTVAATAHRVRQDKFEPNDWATNRGAGTSRSNDANDG
ncbi:hypothetical protein [Chenggangzhangella methanolivorans]|uniref:DUF4148 domain-containing protein n=1 Tax=Chenggangzhangella methanolivorans TaxID=1437009 RepID=A0A9E6UPE3_9HYPH|nr:hypothetical protein [Chenggangzhangella methanolivorans]QZO01324.1 hypothetical protein K6K41_07495 [Chenggangzhangella methanolivorans]